MMIPYFILILVPLLFQLGLEFSNKSIFIGKKRKKVTADNIALPIFFFLLLLILVLRDDTIGRDLSNYNIIFNAIGNGELFKSYYDVREPAFQIYNWFVYNYISSNFQVFIAITAIITIIPIAIVYCKDKSFGYMKMIIFVNMSTFIMLFSGIRQGLAMALGILGYQALKEGKTFRYIIFAMLATFTHHTGFMTFLILPLYRFRFRKIDLFWIIPVAGVVIVLNNRIFNYLVAFMVSFDEKYAAVADSTGAIWTFILFLLFTVFCYIITDDKQMDDEAFALRNILMFATIIQSFASLNPLAMRMNYYFILMIPMALGKCFNFIDSRYAQVTKVGEAVICVFFTILFIYSTYKSFITGISALDTIPYVPFWRG